jgi:hypothetical protein
MSPLVTSSSERTASFWQCASAARLLVGHLVRGSASRKASTTQKKSTEKCRHNKSLPVWIQGERGKRGLGQTAQRGASWSALLTKNYPGDQIWTRRMRWAGHVARMGEKRGAYRILVGRPEGRRPLGRPRRIWEDNIKMDLQAVGWGNRQDWVGSE